MNDILIIGAGYTGMMAAVGIARRTKAANVTLLNPTDRFNERLRQHQVAAGQELGDHRIPDLVEPAGVRFVEGWAAEIDAAGRRVVLGDGRELHYDTLVYAVGSSTPAVDHAYTIADPKLADALRDNATGVLTVCGAGLTGIEAATEAAEAYPRMTVRLLSRGEPGSMMGPKARAHLNRALDRLGVEVRTGVTISKVLPGAIELEDGDRLPTDVTLWTTGVRVAPLAAQAGITTDDTGRVVVDATLRSVSHPEIFAIGDAAAIRQGYGTIHGTCQSGIPSAAHTAESITRQLKGKAPKSFRFGYIHQPVSLGRKDAVIQFTNPDDTPGRFYLKGKAAVFYKESVSGSPLKFYRMRMAVPAKLTGRTGGRRNRLP
ncbi:NAD(P)/FAD-dependent oxidoreductase [Glycomyces buryatensis]|uniref:FAD-dependent oxidoreductase n=1 Tax=Glycomyces buryatensis TaxID=2570927 RepID=A0A4V6T6R9_9ACTN|nr:FAD-dependent oxidoreductase [Glycomyces buryatensis]THV42806.1 FAD-dependent oxidoreductase [Glycomyces buryatensis]